MADKNPPRVPKLKKILFLVTNPKETHPLRLDQEVLEIHEGLRRLKQRNQFELKLQWAVRIQDLRRVLLDESPQIVHFCGRGYKKDASGREKSGSGIILEDEKGNTMLSGYVLAEVIGFFADSIECVVLNACYSENQAREIGKHIPYVVGMSKAIDDNAAIEFAIGFYSGIGAGRTVESAFQIGCNAIRLKNILEHLTPVLLKQPNAPNYLSNTEPGGKSPEKSDQIVVDGSKVKQEANVNSGDIYQAGGDISIIDIPKSIPDEVYIGVSTPQHVSPCETFVARFVAYTDSNRNKVLQKLELESPYSNKRLDLDNCRWHRNAKITVYLDSNVANVSKPIQAFKWNGSWQILRFEVEVFDNIATKILPLKFNIIVEGLPIMTIWPEVKVLKSEQSGIEFSKTLFFEKATPKSAFASYASYDRQEVLGRVRSLQIFTGIDVFLDCLSLRPGEKWKQRLFEEINKRDIFWLFWSREALKSEWVDWEWRTALTLKSLEGIQPHPLESAELAPPPKELSVLQFGTIYESYISQLRISLTSYYVRTFCQRSKSLLRKLLERLTSLLKL